MKLLTKRLGTELPALVTNIPSPAAAVVPGSHAVPSAYVTAEGSQVAPKSEVGDVGVNLHWRDKMSKYKVKYGTSEEELNKITPMKQLMDYGKNAEVKVSPPHSAKSDTLDSNYQDLQNRIKEDTQESMCDLVHKTVSKVLKETTVYERELTTYLWMRTLQDRVYYKMSNALMNVGDTRAWPNFEALVNDYEKKFTVQVLTDNDLFHLRAATDRDIANIHSHPDMTDMKAARLGWKALKFRLEEEGMSEEKARYSRYYEFATGEKA